MENIQLIYREIIDLFNYLEIIQLISAKTTDCAIKAENRWTFSIYSQ